MSENSLPAIVGCILSSAPVVSTAAEPSAITIPAWEAFAEDIRQLGNAMMARVPARLRDDPQVQQEAGRLLLGSLAARAIEALGSDGDHPVFLPWISGAMNVLQPNADTVYKKAEITPGGSYRLRGQRGSLRIVKVAQVDTLPEETGKVVPGIGVLVYNDFNALHVDKHGRFDVILSGARPSGYSGDWWELNPLAHALLLRLVAYDWSRERDPTFSIERLDMPSRRARPPAAELESRLRNLAPRVGNTALILVDHAEDLRKSGTLNRLQEWHVGGTTLAKIGGLAGQFYYEGAYELSATEALIFETRLPEKCVYWSVILTNDLYETTDWYNNQSSINGAQAHVDKDGVFRAVISDTDPGVTNWLDTAGYLTGVIQGRWTDCSGEPLLPTLRKVALADVDHELPDDTARVTPEEREKAVRERRAQLQWRPIW